MQSDSIMSVGPSTIDYVVALRTAGGIKGKEGHDR